MVRSEHPKNLSKISDNLSLSEDLNLSSMAYGRQKSS